MQSYEIHLGDIQRILFGEVPGTFYMEVIFRTLIVYLILMVSMRLMGKRMSSQLNRNELAALVSLAAAIGIPMQTPDRGLLPAFIIAFVVILYQVIISRQTVKSERFEQISQGNLSILVEDAVMDLKTMQKTRISRQRLFAQLRSEGVKHLGMVKRLYLEANGTFSLIKNAEPVPGIPVLPEWDTDLLSGLCLIVGKSGCNHCGNIVSVSVHSDTPCSHCGAAEWVNAVH